MRLDARALVGGNLKDGPIEKSQRLANRPLPPRPSARRPNSFGIWVLAGWARMVVTDGQRVRLCPSRSTKRQRRA